MLMILAPASAHPSAAAKTADVVPDPESDRPLPMWKVNLFGSGLTPTTPLPLLPIAPMSLLSYAVPHSPSFLIFSSILLSAAVGAIGGLNQTFLRKIIAYSSINHIAWILSAITLSESM